MSRSLQAKAVAPRATGRRAGAWLLALACCAGVVWAQPGAALQYQAYALKHKAAADVEKTLGDLLAQWGPDVHVTIDARSNQVLVRGPDAAQQVARQMIDSLDRPQPSPPAAFAALPLVKSYPCAAERQADVLQRLRTQFAGRSDVRIAADQQTGQVFVLAPPEIQASIAPQLATPPAVTAESAPAPQSRSEPPVENGSKTEVVRLANSRLDQVEAALIRLLGPRLTPYANPATGQVQYAFIDAVGKRVELKGDRQHNALEITGAEPLVGQFVRLAQSLDNPLQPPGKALRVMPVHKADPSKVEQAVRAYRSGSSEGAPSTANPRGATPVLPRSSQIGPGGVNLVSYLFQPAPGTSGTPAAGAAAPTAPAANAPAAGAAPAGQQGTVTATLTAPKSQEMLRALRALGPDVEVEVLPDLDVMILRGRDRDVEELSRIIEQLERLSAETQPVVEVYTLKNASSDALMSIVAKVSDSLTGGMQGRVTMTPLTKPNAILLIGWGEAVKATKDLIEKLDQPVPPESQFRVFPLRHAPAAAARTTLQDFFATRTGTTATAAGATKIQISSDTRTNALVVQAAPGDMAEIAAMIEAIDRDQSAAVNQTRIFKLKYTLAVDLAMTLQAAVSGPRGTAAAPAKSTVLELLTVDQAGQKVIKSGLLVDAQIVADPRLNTLLVSAPAESMDLIAALIQQLDMPVTAAQVKVFRIVNGDALSMMAMLRALLPQSGPAGTTGGAAGGPPGGAQLSVSTDETALAPLRFSVDVRTNSIIAVGSSGDLRIVEALLLRLDEQDVAERKNAVYRLKNAPAMDVATAINEFLRSLRQVQQAAPGGVSPYQQIESEVVVVPEPVSNALILSATPRYFDRINDLIEKLDAQPPQVLIQVVIASVDLHDFDEFGIELGLQDSVLFDRSTVLGNPLSGTGLQNFITTNSAISQSNTHTQGSGTATSTQDTTTSSISAQPIVSGTLVPGYGFNNQPLGNNITANGTSKQVGSQGVSSFSLNRTNSQLGYGGLVLSASSESVSFLLRALEQKQCIQILSRPQIMTLDNQPAYIQVGQRVPRITGTAINQVGSVNSIALENVGLILGVTPRISPEGLVVMEIDAEKSQLDKQDPGVPVSISSTGVPITSPIIDVTTAQTTVSASSGQTVLLGGLITKSNSTIDRRVPWLSDVPILGNLFRYKSTEIERTELLIILTPHVIRNTEEADRARQLEATRMHWCLADLRSVHGEPGGPHARGAVTEIVYPDINPRGGPGEPSPARPFVPPPDPAQPEPVPSPTATPGDAKQSARLPVLRLPWTRQAPASPGNTAQSSPPAAPAGPQATAMPASPIMAGPNAYPQTAPNGGPMPGAADGPVVPTSHVAAPQSGLGQPAGATPSVVPPEYGNPDYGPGGVPNATFPR